MADARRHRRHASGQVAQQTEGRAVVSKGIAAGDRVVVDGVDKLQDGSKVVAHEAGDGAGGEGAPAER